MSMEDVAQRIELHQWELNNRSRPEVVRYQPDQAGYGPELCVNEECEAVMPVKRREWGFQVCTGCQAAAEDRARHFRR